MKKKVKEGEMRDYLEREWRVLKTPTGMGVIKASGLVVLALIPMRLAEHIVDVHNDHLRARIPQKVTP